MEIRIERASESDAEEILSLQRAAYRSEAELYNDYQIEPLVQTLEQLQAQFADHIVLKAVVSDTIVGSIRASADNGTCRIAKLMVSPDAQNNGIGQRLMQAIEAHFPECRYELFTGFKSVKNLRLYEKLGYRAFKERSISPDFSFVYLEKRRE